LSENVPSPDAADNASDESVEELYELALCGYLTTAIDGRIIRVNKTLAAWLGYERPALLVGRRFVDILTVGGRMFYETHFNLLLRIQETVDEIALDLICKDGRILPVLLNARQKRDLKETPVVNRFTIFNATERRTYERRLLEARDLLQTTLASIGDAVIATDLAGLVTFMNPVAEELSGWAQDDAKGKPIEDVLNLVDEVGSAKVANPVRRSLREGVVVGLANRTLLISNSGAAIPIDDSAAPIRNASGVVIGGVMVFRNISAQRLAEKALKEVHQLLRSQAVELQRSNEELSQFVHIASHDLQSPLNTIVRFTQLLERRHSAQLSDGKSLLAHVVNAATRMRALLDSLLMYALATGRAAEPRIAVEAAFQIRGAIENLHSLIEESRAIITHDELPSLLIDETSLMQVFQNLIGNAIQYRSTAAPRIHISARDRGAEWLFTCQDNGMGIEAEYLTKIFDAFERLHGSDRPGSGLGLSTCKKIVERYGGNIWVESQKGTGSTFFFTMPKEREEPQT
jgi:PAS domain S-box-containing protein